MCKDTGEQPKRDRVHCTIAWAARVDGMSNDVLALRQQKLRDFLNIPNRMTVNRLTPFDADDEAMHWLTIAEEEKLISIRYI